MRLSIFLFSILNLSAQIPFDKKLHLATGVVIGVIASHHSSHPVRDAFIASAVAGIAKELIDKKRYGHFDQLDIQFTISGAMISSFTRRRIRQPYH